MARILFVTWDGGGNVPPAVGIADEMRQRGHEVTFLGHAQQRKHFEIAGYPFMAYSHTVPWSSVEPTSGLAAGRRIFAMFTDKGQGRDLRELLGRQPADLLVLDCMLLGALDFARHSGPPYAVLVHTYWEYLTRSWIRSPIGVLARLKGLRPSAAWAGATNVLVATDATLDPASQRHLPENVQHIGVVQPPPTPAAVDREAVPRVLVSLSTTYFDGQQEALQAVLDGLDGLDLHAIVTTGHSIDPAELRAPSNVELHRLLPHDQIMPGVRLVIGHGGHATTMRALAHNAPLIVLPMHAFLDQKMIGRSVADQGAGVLLTRQATSQQIRESVQALLPDGPAHHAAAQIGARLRGQQAALHAANALEATLHRRSGPRT